MPRIQSVIVPAPITWLATIARTIATSAITTNDHDPRLIGIFYQLLAGPHPRSRTLRRSKTHYGHPNADAALGTPAPRAGLRAAVAVCGCHARSRALRRSKTLFLSVADARASIPA
jgi:hypothetical protein